MMKRSSETNPSVPGFSFAGVSAGIKKAGAKDLALIYSEIPAVTAGVFTTNTIKAAPVRRSISILRKYHRSRAIVINSGNANACTGKQGERDAEDIAHTTARTLGIRPQDVHTASTGVIGATLPVADIKNALPSLLSKLSPDAISEAASAIMTTDTFPKIAASKVKIGRKTGTIAGIAKGSGMICPGMATMLCFLFTDIAINKSQLRKCLFRTVNNSFNRISVDNDMSTNDTVMIMANGLLGNPTLSADSPDYPKFISALEDVAMHLARMIVRDGEGATKLIEISVRGASNSADAGRVARAVATSMLVKTAIYGGDPNWGRIMAAIGYSGARVVENKISISINGITLVRRGIGTGKENLLVMSSGGDKVLVIIDLGLGKATADFMTSDLTEGYININAHYRT